jgi:hypothetical protein
VPLTAVACKGISAARRERIEAAVAAAGQRHARPYEAWIAAGPFPGGVRVLITGPRGFERTVAIALDEAPKRIVRPAARRRRICRAEEALDGCPESQGGGGDAGTCESRQEEARPQPRGTGADRRGHEKALGGGEEGQGRREISRAGESDAGGGQTGAEARCPDRRGQEIKAGGRAAEGGWPGEGGVNATDRGEGASQDRRGAGDGGDTCGERTSRCGGTSGTRAFRRAWRDGSGLARAGIIRK